jgi:hypothetical protein
MGSLMTEVVRLQAAGATEAGKRGHALVEMLREQAAPLQQFEREIFGGLISFGGPGTVSNGCTNRRPSL